MRRLRRAPLTDTQLSYYRAAHRLHHIAGLGDERTHHAPAPDALIKQLDELAARGPTATSTATGRAPGGGVRSSTTFGTGPKGGDSTPP
ncbi:hypothetical protein ACFQ3Z_38385 [Streptomyces nogalater]